MFIFNLQLFSFLLLSASTTTTTTTTTNAQPYKATDHIFLDCGTSSTTSSFSRQWDGEGSAFLPSNTTVSFLSTLAVQYPPPRQTLYTTARISITSSFTYNFPVSLGPKFLRHYFYPATYSDLNQNQSLFSVSSNGFSLVTNFSASITASFLSQACVVNEFIIYVKDTQTLNVTFTPSPNSFAFINGIEVVSMPENLYFRGDNMKYVDGNFGPAINNYTALENIYRINVGNGGYISGESDTGMYRSWDSDERYIFPSNAHGFTPSMETPITYSTDTPNYTAPELVYQTQRSIGNFSRLRWLLPVDSGFYYVIRLHFCSIIQQYTFKGQMFFKIFINNEIVEKEADLFYWTPGRGYAVFKDYGVFVGESGNRGSKPDLSLDLYPNDQSYGYLDGFLNGIEVFKLNMTRNLSIPNPKLSSTTPTSSVKRNNKKPYVVVVEGVGGGIVLLSVLVLIVL